MPNRPRIIFSITILFLTGMMIGIVFGQVLPIYFANLPELSTAFKGMFLLAFSLYFLEFLLAVIGCYVLLFHNKVNIYLLFATLIFSFEMSINEMRFTFMPFDLNFLFKFNLDNSVLGFGLNFLGIFFIVWWVWLRKKVTKAPKKI